MNPLNNVREAILAELEPLNREEDELKERIDQLTRTKAPLLAALKEVDPRTRKKRKTNVKAAKRTAKQDDVRAVCLAVASENPAITRDELENVVKHKLIDELGFDLKGIGLRFKEVLSADTFMIAHDGSVSLVPTAPHQAVAIS